MNDTPPRLPSDLDNEILAFVGSLRQPKILEEGSVLLQLSQELPESGADSGWRLEVKFGKLPRQLWGSSRSIVRRIESVERDGSTLQVCPAFRFHSTTERILRYFQPSIRVVKVGIHQNWREGVKVLFRRTRQQACVLEAGPDRM